MLQQRTVLVAQSVTVVSSRDQLGFGQFAEPLGGVDDSAVAGDCAAMVSSVWTF